MTLPMPQMVSHRQIPIQCGASEVFDDSNMGLALAPCQLALRQYVLPVRAGDHELDDQPGSAACMCVQIELT